MLPALTVIDDFLGYEKALEIRNRVLAGEFKDLSFMGGVYQGTCVNVEAPEIKEGLEKFFSSKIELAIQAFRNGHKDTTLHVNIHSDNVITRWAAVYYLNLPEQCRGGTAFYQLKDTGWDTMPTQDVLDWSGKTLDWLKTKWTDEDAWHMTSFAGMKFDRLIFYPSEYFHSRYPLQGWGDGKDDGRMVWVGFFDLV